MTALIAAALILTIALWLALAATISAVRVCLRGLSHVFFGYRALPPGTGGSNPSRVAVEYPPARSERARSGDTDDRRNWDANR